VTFAKKRSTRSILLSIALTLGLVAPTFAASQSATSTETLTVNASITLTGVPTSLSYGSTLGAQKLSATMTGVHVFTNNPTGMKVTATASDLTAGGNTIAATNRAFKFGGSAEVPYTTANTVLTTFPGPVPDTAADIVASVNVPANAMPGAYTGSVTITAVTNP
jgi:hypothetical protein